MLHVVSYSTGLSSALTVDRVIAQYGRENTHVVFMDTLIEDEDNYRFLHDCQTRWQMPVTILTEGRTPYQVFTDEHIIPNSRIAPCTKRLKIEMCVAWLETLPKPLTIHIGYDYTEAERCGPTEENYKAHGYDVDFPLLWKPYEFRKYEDIARYEWGIEPPRMYEMGYTHANCGGRCVKQGQGDWLRTLINFPERYAEAEDWEQEMRKNPVNADYAILKDRTGGGCEAPDPERIAAATSRENHKAAVIHTGYAKRLCPLRYRGFVLPQNGGSTCLTGPSG